MKAPAALINHRKLAAILGESTQTVRRWIEGRHFPRPHSVVGVTLFYRVEDVDHYLAKGVWPEAMLRKDRKGG